MAEEIVDIIHRLSYHVESESLERVTSEMQTQLVRIEQLKGRMAQLSAAYDRTSTTEITKRERIRQLIIQTAGSIEKESDAVENTLLNNKELNTALQKQVGLVGALDQRLELLRVRRDRAFDPDRVKHYNKLIAESEAKRAPLLAVQPPIFPTTPSAPPPTTGGLGFGGMLGAVAGGNVIANLFTSATTALKGFATDVVSTTQKYEKLSSLLSNTLGGKAAGAAAFTMLADLAAETPFQLDELTAAYLKLVNRGIRPTKAELEAFGDIAAAQGKSFDQFTEAILDAVTGEFERLKEFGIKAKQNGDMVTLAFGNIVKTVPKTGEAIKKALIEIRNQAPGIAGAMKVISGTIEGQLSNIGDGFDRLKNSIGGRFTDSIKGSLSLFSDLISTFNDFIEISEGDKLEAERLQINALVLSLMDVNTSEQTRSDIISELNSKYPELVSNINFEAASQEKLLGFLDGVNRAYSQKIEISALSEIATSANKEAVEAQKRELEAVKKLNKELLKLGFTRDQIARGVTLSQIGAKSQQGYSTLSAIQFFGDVRDAREDLRKASEDGLLAQRNIDDARRAQSGTNAELIKQYKAGVETYGKLVEETKAKLGEINLGDVLSPDKRQLANDLQVYQKAFEQFSGLLLGLTNATATPTPKKTGESSSPTEDNKKKKEKKTDPLQEALKAENERFEKEKADRAVWYDLRRLEARKKYHDNEKLLAAEFLKIKEDQELDSYNRTTGNTDSHLNRLYEIYRKFHELRSANAAKVNAQITKNEEDEAKRRADIAARNKKKTDEQAAAVLSSANKRIVEAQNSARKRTEDALARNEANRSLAMLGANAMAGGVVIDPVNEFLGREKLEGEQLIKPNETKKISEKAFQQLQKEINDTFDKNALLIKIDQAKADLADLSLNLTEAQREQLRRVIVDAQSKLVDLSRKKDSPTNQAIEGYETLASAAVSAYQQIAQASQESMEAQISHQNRRVDQAQRIADKGNAELLQREEKRLEDMNKKKEAAAKREMVINQALALSNAIVAVAKAAGWGAAQGGYGAIATVSATLAALAAGYVLVRTLTTDTPGFKDGVIDLKGPGTTKSDSINARLSRGESVMTAEATQRYKPILEDMNKLRYKVELPNYDKPPAKEIIAAQREQRSGSDYDFRRLEKRIDNLTNVILEKPDTSVTLDADGLSVRTQRLIWKKERNKRL